MDDVWLGFGLQWLIVFGALALLTLAPQTKPNPTWLAVAVLFFAANTASLFYLKHYVPVASLVGHELHWNWGGKIAAIVVSLLLLTGLWFVAKKNPSESGVTLKQNPGSLIPALIAIAILLAFDIGVSLYFGQTPQTDAERLIYQATMPGFDEELFWRGVFLLAMTEAARGRRFNLLGAHLSWGGVLVSILFGLAHGLAFDHGALQFAWDTALITGLIGFGLVWIRERTGSILLPIVAHNLVNFAISFV